MSLSITSAQIKAIAGSGARADLVGAIVSGWPAAVAKAKLTTRNRAAHFLAQIMTETGGLRILEESGAYKAARIMVIFGEGRHSAGITEPEARRIAALPVAQRGPVLFNRVYGRGNPKKMREFQNTGPNDGWLYRGGGMMQNTGKSNYAKLAKKTGLPLVEHPDLLRDPETAMQCGVLWWEKRVPDSAIDSIERATRAVQGGKLGLEDRRKLTEDAGKALAPFL